ncbi:MAG: hypothetical protein ABFS41_16565 [Myxococcota bacterium]
MLRTLKRLVIEEQGMEMVEWAIVGVVFAVAAAGAWTILEGSIDSALQDIGAEVDPDSGTGTGTG